MSTNTKNGFTMIELILFFGIAAILTVSLMAGSGVAVSQQRYRDSVQSLRGELQDQYGGVSSVMNNRDDNLSCNAAGSVGEAGGATPRGTSENCVLIGKFIQSYQASSDVPDGAALHVHPVIAAMSGDLDPDITNDTEAIQQYNLALDTRRYEAHLLEWDSLARVQGLTGGAQNQFSILIARSPLSGSVLTYISSGSATANPNAMVTASNLQNELTICVDPAGNEVITGEKMAVRIQANASNPSGVEMISQEAGNGC